MNGENPSPANLDQIDRAGRAEELMDIQKNVHARRLRSVRTEDLAEQRSDLWMQLLLSKQPNTGGCIPLPS
jgi:hypothetical protein